MGSFARESIAQQNHAYGEIMIPFPFNKFAMLVLLLFALFACATKPVGPTQTVYAAEVALADAVSALGAAKAKIDPVTFANAVKAEQAAKAVLYDAEKSAMSGNATATQTALCAFQSSLNQVIAA